MVGDASPQRSPEQDRLGEAVIRPMRGQVVIRETLPSHPLYIPTPRARDVKTHTGRVLAMGPPAVEGVDPGFNVGDLVQYHFTIHQEAHTVLWEDGAPATWIPMRDVDAVWYERQETTC